MAFKVEYSNDKIDLDINAMRYEAAAFIKDRKAHAPKAPGTADLEYSAPWRAQDKAEKTADIFRSIAEATTKKELNAALATLEKSVFAVPVQPETGPGYLKFEPDAAFYFTHFTTIQVVRQSLARHPELDGPVPRITRPGSTGVFLG